MNDWIPVVGTLVSAAAAVLIGYLTFRSANKQRDVEIRQSQQETDLNEQKVITEGMRELIDLLKDDRTDLRDQLSSCRGDCETIRRDNVRINEELHESRQKIAALEHQLGEYETTILRLQGRDDGGT